MPGSPSLPSPSLPQPPQSISSLQPRHTFAALLPDSLVLHRSHHSHDGTTSRPLISLVGVIANRLGEYWVTAITWVNLATSFDNNNLKRNDLAHSREFCLRFMQSPRPRNAPRELYQVVRKPVVAVHLRP